VAEGEGRVFLRGITSEQYGLAEFRRRQLAAPRVRRAGTVVDDASVAHSGDSAQSRTWWILGPGDDPFLTQTIQMHFVELFPGGSNRGHGHQNEATFYILEGRGYEIHDGKRYDWEKDDLVVVHDSAYSEICFDGYRAPSFLATPGAKEVGVEIIAVPTDAAPDAIKQLGAEPRIISGIARVKRPGAEITLWMSITGRDRIPGIDGRPVRPWELMSPCCGPTRSAPQSRPVQTVRLPPCTRTGRPARPPCGAS